MFTEKEDIKKWLKSINIVKNYTIKPNLSIYVWDNVIIKGSHVTEGGVLPVQFDMIKGIFDCSNCLLTSLKGSPSSCWEFNCSNNCLDSLEFGPKMVDGHYFCDNNLLKTLAYLPIEVGQDFDIQNNRDLTFITDELKKGKFGHIHLDYDILRHNKINDFNFENGAISFHAEASQNFLGLEPSLQNTYCVSDSNLDYAIEREYIYYTQKEKERLESMIINSSGISGKNKRFKL